jgi:hypothetical protein
MYSIIVDKVRRRLRLKLFGQWDISTVEAFERELELTLERQGWGRGDYDCLVDLREQGIQTQEVAERGGRVTAGGGARSPRYSAMIVDGALKRLQVGRVVTDYDKKFFTSEEEAVSWLDEMAAAASNAS